MAIIPVKQSFVRSRRTGFGGERVTRRAFTLIELLVVVAVIGVLVSILLPALGGARIAANRARELSAGQQLMVAYTLYADDNADAVLPGYATAQMCLETPIPGFPTLDVFDETGEALYGVAARRYPWRIAPYLEYNFAGLYKDKNVLSSYRAREDFQYVVSISPSLAINGVFVGGDADKFAFNRSALDQWGPFYITRMDQARRPDNLLVFASARGVDANGGGLVPGYFRLEPPAFQRRQWVADFDAADTPGQYGFIDLRYQGQAVFAALDGHADTARSDELDDMRLWSNSADRSDWVLE